MIPQNDARIFLAKNRIAIQANGVKSLSTFNTNNPDSKLPAKPVLQLKDTVLAAGKSTQIVAADSADLILLPVAGALDYYYNGTAFFTEPGNVHCISLTKNDAIECSNPYTDEAVNIIQIWIKKGYIHATEENLFSNFDIDANRNKLIRLFNAIKSSNGIQFFAGRFDGRREAQYKISHKGNAVFAFVINGAFEVQHRLIETRDGLILWNLNEVEIEALSENAVILLAEFPVIR